MKRFLGVAVILAFAAGCSGGGGSSNGGSGGGGGYAPPGPSYANTANPHYFPFAFGNSWTMASGGILSDKGAGSLTCTCDWNGQSVEAIDITTPAGAYGSTFILSKKAPGGAFGTNLLTYLDGTSSDHGSTVNLIVDGTGHTGIMIADDNPSNNEFMNAAGGSSTIYPIGGIQAYQGTQIDQIATDTLTAPGVSLIWGFAKGVGMTSLNIPGSGATTLTSFSINAASSTTTRITAAIDRPVHVVGAESADAALQALRSLVTR